MIFTIDDAFSCGMNINIDREWILREAENEPGLVTNLIALSARLYNENKFMEARHILSALTEAVPENYEVWNDLGVIQLTLNEVEEAEKSFMRALSINRYYFESYINLGELYKLLGRHEEASKCLKTCLNLRRQRESEVNSKTTLTMGWMHYASGNYDEAALLFQKVADSKNDNPQIYLDLRLAIMKLEKARNSATIRMSDSLGSKGRP